MAKHKPANEELHSVSCEAPLTPGTERPAPMAEHTYNPKPNGAHVSATHEIFEAARHAGWLLQFAWQAWPVIVVLGGVIFAAGSVTQQMKSVAAKIEAHDAQLKDLQSSGIDAKIWQTRVDDKLDFVIDKLATLPSTISPPQNITPRKAIQKPKPWSLFRRWTE